MIAPLTTMNEYADRRNWLIAGSIAVLLAAPWFVMAHGSVADEREEVRAHLAGMTATERQRLERNFEQFQQLSPHEREKLHELHQAVEQDSELRNVLTTYYEWFKTRSTWERYELRPEEDTPKRVARIREMLAREQERQSGFSEDWRKKNAFGPRMTDEDVAPVLAAFQRWVEHQAEPQRSEFLSGRPTPGRLDELPRLQQRIHLLRIMAFVLRAQRVLGNSENSPPLHEWIEAIPSEDLRDFMLSRPEEEQRKLLLFKLNFRLWDEYRREYTEVQPQDEDLKQFLLSLDSERQDRFLSLPPHEFERELRREYIRAKLPEIDRAGEELRNLSGDIRDAMGFGTRRGEESGRRASENRSDRPRRSSSRGRSGSSREPSGVDQPAARDGNSQDKSD